ncbi:hypothetical protein [Alicyclobacillus ferrooxydans]|uniref:Uncharacterized protein n=1 Tax=Alicyclobacillus ferrooxydans TaxID=471514 RepID=A0A0P9GFY8_9BACL|nr:hypothetical protein [Alicyclobacillus ferrooxydans]KPV38943.1 hypothetical protein AN477_23155 [Alicyclobacillus ferrooxydans]
MRRRVWTLSLGLLAVILCGIVVWHIHRVYYFNPFTFKQDDVTTASWNVYKTPMEMDIVYQPVHGTQTRYTTENRSEINYVLTQLREGKPMSYKPIIGLSTGQIWIQFRNPVNQNDYVDAILRQNMKVALLAQQNPITVTSGLKRFVEAKKNSAKTM